MPSGQILNLFPAVPKTRGAPLREIIVDNFAGGGGASTGIKMALGRSPDVAINHDAEAVALHQANHPGHAPLLPERVEGRPARRHARPTGGAGVVQPGLQALQ